MSFSALRLAFIVVTALLLAWATRMPAAQWLDQLAAQRNGQMPLLLARAASLAMLLLLAPTLKRSLVAVALALCTASLAINAAAVPFAFLVIALSRPTIARAAIAGVVGLAVGFALAQREPTREAMPTDARGVALYWEQRDNPFRALEAARAWAATDPREATLCMARIAERLGDVDDARALRESVATEGAR